MGQPVIGVTQPMAIESAIAFRCSASCRLPILRKAATMAICSARGPVDPVSQLQIVWLDTRSNRAVCETE